MQTRILHYHWWLRSGSLSEKQKKESVIRLRAELKRCMSIEMRWNRNEVSLESPDKEVNRRPTSLKKFRADALSGPRPGSQLRPVGI